MISSEFGKVTLTGSEASIMAEMTCLLRAVRKTLVEERGEEVADEYMNNVWDTSKKTSQELRNEVLDDILKSKDILEGIKKANEAIDELISMVMDKGEDEEDQQ